MLLRGVVYRHLTTFALLVLVTEALVHKLIDCEPSPQENPSLTVLGIHRVLGIQGSCTAKVCALLSRTQHVEGSETLCTCECVCVCLCVSVCLSVCVPTILCAFSSCSSISLSVTICSYILTTISSLNYTHTHTQNMVNSDITHYNHYGNETTTPSCTWGSSAGSMTTPLSSITRYVGIVSDVECVVMASVMVVVTGKPR